MQGPALEPRRQLPRHARPSRGIGGVLRQLRQQPITISGAHQIGLGGRVLTQPRRRSAPRIEHPRPKARRPEPIPHDVAQLDSAAPEAPSASCRTRTADTAQAS